MMMSPLFRLGAILRRRIPNDPCGEAQELSHYGIVVKVRPNIQVIEFLPSGQVRESSLRDFGDGQPIQQVRIPSNSYHRRELVYRARYMLNLPLQYCPKHFNSEHFVNFILDNQPRPMSYHFPPAKRLRKARNSAQEAQELPTIELPIIPSLDAQYTRRLNSSSRFLIRLAAMSRLERIKKHFESQQEEAPPHSRLRPLLESQYPETSQALIKYLAC